MKAKTEGKGTEDEELGLVYYRTMESELLLIFAPRLFDRLVSFKWPFHERTERPVQDC